MNQELAMERWNAKFRPGQRVIVEKPIYSGRTITRAEIRDGTAMIYIEALFGPVPLAWCKPEARQCIEAFE